MSHFVTKPNHNSRKYYIFSTVVMNAISPKMYKAEMEAWLKEHKYDEYLDPRPWSEQLEEPNYKVSENVDKYSYWNGSFWYVLEEDGYFV